MSANGLPNVSGKRLVKVLERRGWYVKRVRGRHHIQRHPEIPDAVPVPVHGERQSGRSPLRRVPA